MSKRDKIINILQFAFNNILTKKTNKKVEQLYFSIQNKYIYLNFDAPSVVLCRIKKCLWQQFLLFRQKGLTK